MGHRESGYLAWVGKGEGRPLRWSETCRTGSLRHFFLPGALSEAPKLGIPELSPGHCGAPTPRLVAMTYGSTSVEWHCQGRMQKAHSRV